MSVLLGNAFLGGLRAQLERPGAAPQSEVGGILLGRTESDEDFVQTVVEAFEPFEIEYRYSQSYSLSSHDWLRLERRLSRKWRGGLVPVGLWRSHARRGLYLDQRDFDLFKRFFGPPGAIFVLAGRDEAEGAKAGVFIWEDNDVRRHQSYLEFPLEPVAVAPISVSAGKVAPGVMDTSEPVTDSVAPPVRSTPAWSWVTWSGPASTKPANVWSWPTWSRSTSPKPAAVAQPAVLDTLSQPEPPPERKPDLPVAVAAPPPKPPAGQDVVFPATSARASTSPAWFRPAGLLRAAMVVVSIGLPLAAFYIGRSVAKNRERSAAVMRPQIAPPPQTAQTTELPAPVSATDESADHPSPFATLDTADRSAVVPASKTRRRIEIPVALTAPARTLPSIPDAPAVAQNVSSALLPKFVSSAPSAPALRTETVVAYVKPARGSGVRHALRKIFGGNTNREDYVPASPVAHPMPTVPPNQISEGETSVELVAKIDRTGTVAHVKFSEGNNQLTDASASALSQWRFEPARQNGAPVESDMLIRFEFRKKP